MKYTDKKNESTCSYIKSKAISQTNTKISNLDLALVSSNFPERVGPRSLSLKSVIYFGTSKYLQN